MKNFIFILIVALAFFLIYGSIRKESSSQEVKTGIVVNCMPYAKGGTIKDCLHDFLQGTKLPAIYDFNFGHTPSRHVLPLGAKASLNADKATLKILKY
ncbi:MAG: hypothetical protein J6T72_01510 [Alphaproteobacteria bacterium]|nr:hypothetical protein [Alphaproteobacteria bacterium]